MSPISTISGGVDAALNNKATEQTTRKQVDAQRVAPPPREKPSKDDLQIVDPEDMRRLMDELQRALDDAAPQPLKVDFKQDQRADGYVVEIRNQKGDLVRQFPPEKVLNMRSRLAELTGMVIDEMT